MASLGCNELIEVGPLGNGYDQSVLSKFWSGKWIEAKLKKINVKTTTEKYFLGVVSGSSFKLLTHWGLVTTDGVIGRGPYWLR